jgi:hypothetical protein
MGKKVKIPEWIKWERQARRLVEIEQKTPKVHATTHLTHKRDILEKVRNTVRSEDYET